MLWTVFLFFKNLNTQERAKIGDSRELWNAVCVSRLPLAGPIAVNLGPLWLTVPARVL